MKTKLTTLLVLFISTALFAQDNWKTLDQDNYSINYPEHWTYSDQKPQPTIQFVLMSEEESQKEDMFRENINLNTEDLRGQTMSLEAYAKLSLDQIMGQIPSAIITYNTDVKLEGEDAKEIGWAADFGNGMKLLFKQVFIINNGIAYVLTFSATTTDYDKYSEVANKILYSFKFTK